MLAYRCVCHICYLFPCRLSMCLVRHSCPFIFLVGGSKWLPGFAMVWATHVVCEICDEYHVLLLIQVVHGFLSFLST